MDFPENALENYRQLAVDPASFRIELDLPDTPGYSPVVVEDIIQGRHAVFQYVDRRLAARALSEG